MPEITKPSAPSYTEIASVTSPIYKDVNERTWDDCTMIWDNALFRWDGLVDWEPIDPPDTGVSPVWNVVDEYWNSLDYTWNEYASGQIYSENIKPNASIYTEITKP